VLGMKSPAQVMKTLDSVRVVREQNLSSFVNANELDQEFLNYMKEVIAYQCMTEGAVYRKNSENYQSEAFTTQRPEFEQYLRTLPLDNPRVLYSEIYQNYVRTLLAGDVLEKMEVKSPEDLPAFYYTTMQLAAGQLKTQEVRNYILKEIMVEAMKESGTRDITGCMELLEQENDNEPMKERVRKIWRQYEAIQPGSVCPPIEQYTSDGEVVTMSHFAGKVVYIDVWATWCGPCKKEIPHLKTLEEKYHGKNIEFVSISTDQDVNKWKEFIATESMSGLQLHQSDEAEKTISRYFVINSIPRFILIDESGKIVSADAPRPSSGQTLYGLIDSVLND
jgi:thiol-disulfide isomerase/thioredoxin